MAVRQVISSLFEEWSGAQQLRSTAQGTGNELAQFVRRKGQQENEIGGVREAAIYSFGTEGSGDNKQGRGREKGSERVGGDWVSGQGPPGSTRC